MFPIPGSADPIAVATAPTRPAPMAENAALPTGSPAKYANAKSRRPKRIGILRGTFLNAFLAALKIPLVDCSPAFAVSSTPSTTLLPTLPIGRASPPATSLTFLAASLAESIPNKTLSVKGSSFLLIPPNLSGLTILNSLSSLILFLT